jgi:alginate O-acetyltransferase complex protein AlgJ
MSIVTGPKIRHKVPRRVGPGSGGTSKEIAREDLSRGVIVTEIDHRLAWVLSVAFMATIVLLPLAQATIELFRQGDIQTFRVFSRLPTPTNLVAFEAELSRRSIAQKAVQPRLQLSLSRYLGFGTTNVILGRNGWLFYQPGIELVTGPGLLDRDRLALAKRELIDAGEVKPSPDPRPAIRAFNEDCRKAGVHLVVMPVPEKAMLQPKELTARLDRKTPRTVPANIDYARILDELRRDGVDVFDPSPKRLNPREPARFLRQDSHWKPEWMEDVARDLSEHLKSRIPSLRVPTRSWWLERREVSRVGDIVDMLKLPAGQQLYLPQTVMIHRVLDASNGRLWQPSAEADVLLLGDSFSNIYCTPDLGWGESAGLPAQLARFLKRDVDVIARNGSAATATRRELARRSQPLKGKTVVVWEFAARELMHANWEVVSIAASRPETAVTQTVTAQAESTGTIVLEATIVATSRVPQSYAVPYKDCLTCSKLRVDRVVNGDFQDDHVIAVFWGMRDNVRLPAADYAPGKRVRLNLVPMRQAPHTLRTARIADDLDDVERRPYYVVEERSL